MNNQEFIKLYNEFEVLLRQKYDEYDEYYSVVKKYEKESAEPVKSRIKLIRELRNLLVHSVTINDEVSFEISDESIEFLTKQIELLKKPITAFDIATKKDKLLFASTNTKVFDLIETMSKSRFSHVPVLNRNDEVIGVFSENSLFQFVLKNNGKIDIKNDFKIKNILEYISIYNNRSEKYLFVKEDEDVNQIENLFKKNDFNEKRLAMIFVTKNGSNNEPLLGIITPFDLMGL